MQTKTETLLLQLGNISLFGVNIPIISIISGIAFIFSLYAVWREGRRDGFSEERLFDNYILSLIIAFTFSRISYAITARFLFLPLETRKETMIIMVTTLPILILITLSLF